MHAKYTAALLTAALLAALSPAPADVSLENDHCRWVVADDTTTRSFVVKAAGKDLAAGARPVQLAAVYDGRQWHPAATIAADKDTWRLGFAGHPATLRLKVAAKTDHLLIEPAGPIPDGIERVVFAQAPLDLPRETIGHYWPMGRTGNHHVVFAALSPHVRGVQFYSRGTVFRAEAWRSVGFENLRLAVVVSAADDTLGVIERLQTAYGLPHLTLGGTWFRTSPLLREPYLFTDLDAHNVDRVIRFARRGGFGYVMTFSGVWCTANGSYPINTKRYPRGMADLKAVADKLHAAGIKLGLHMLSACISPHDPYVRPVPDSRLAVARRFTLTRDIGPGDDEIPVDGSAAGMARVDSYATRGCDLWIGDEIVTYRGRTGGDRAAFTGCLRGRRGTARAAHTAGTPVRYLHRLYNMYLPDPATDLLPEIAARVATIFNTVGADMIYFDGGEAMGILGRGWHDTHRIHREFARRLDREVLISGSGGNGGFGWHVHMRGNANDGVHNNTKRYLDEHKVPDRIDYYHRNLAAAEIGWLNLRSRDLSHPPTQPDEWEYFCCKGLAHDAPVSLHMHTRYFDDNGRAGECLDIINRYQRAKRTGQFGESLPATLREPGREFKLTGDETAGWRFRRMQYGPRRLVTFDRPDGAAWTLNNPFAGQPLAARITARPALRPFGHEANCNLFDPATPVTWQPDGTRGARCTAGLSDRTTPDGTPALRLTAAAGDRPPDRRTRAWVAHAFADRPDLREHRSLALWVRGDGSGALLDVQLVDASLIRAREYTVPLDFTGWRKVRIVDPDFDAPYEFPLFRHKGNLASFRYRGVREIRLLLANLPKEGPVAVDVGRIEALAEVDRPLVNPVIRAGKRALRLPVTVKVDEMAELSADGTVRVFDRTNAPIRTITLAAPPPALRPGANALRLEAKGEKPFAYVEPILSGSVVGN